MEREQLSALALGEEQIDRVLALNGQDVAAEKARADALLADYDPDWRQKAAQAEERAAQTEAKYAARALADGLHFTSRSAQKAFLDALVQKHLPVEDGRFLGAEKFIGQYRAEDPGAFAAGRPLAITAAAPGRPARPNEKNRVNAAIRAALGKE